jgi:predicted Fe-S protein YdhL (DUF1289 family)
MLPGDSLRQPLPHPRIGAGSHGRISKPGIAVGYEAQRSPGSELFEDEGRFCICCGGTWRSREVCNWQKKGNDESQATWERSRLKAREGSFHSDRLPLVKQERGNKPNAAIVDPRWMK